MRTMSFSLWPWLAKGIPLKGKNRSEIGTRTRRDAVRNPRAAGRSGCTPAEPYPPRPCGKDTLTERTTQMFSQQKSKNGKEVKCVTHVPGRKCYPCIGTFTSVKLEAGIDPSMEENGIGEQRRSGLQFKQGE